jgi:DNA-binding transcriptional regulator YiaG
LREWLDNDLLTSSQRMVTVESLESHRNRTGLSRERAAGLLTPPISSSTLARWERGARVPGWRETQLRRLYDHVLNEGR